MKAFNSLKGKVEAFKHQAQAPLQQQSSSSSPASPPSSSSNKTNKRGLCWPLENNNNSDPIFPFTKPGSKISWIYNWSPNPSPDASSLEFIPMTWNTSNFAAEISKINDSGATHLLSFNEPELPDQSNISAQQAAEEWLAHVEPLRKSGKGVRCGSPGISNAGHAVGWLQDFLKRIREKGGDVDFLCLHWYGGDLGGFYDYIWSSHHQLDPNKPVWITEFAATNWNPNDPLPREHVENFAKESFKYLDTLDWVERYAWFGPMRDTGTVGKWAALIGEDGQPNALGKVYRDA